MTHLEVVYAVRAVPVLAAGIIALLMYRAHPKKTKLVDELQNSLDSAMSGLEAQINTDDEPYFSPEIISKAVVQSEITSQVTYSPELSRLMNTAYNPNLKIDFQSMVASERIWVYNVSRIAVEIDNHTLGHVKIPGNTSRKRYALYTSFPSVMISTKEDIDNTALIMFPESGERFIMDLINPDNPGVDQSFMANYHTGIGRDLGQKGIFWSKSNPPKKSEVDAAVLRMETRYRSLLEQMEIIYESLIINEDRVIQFMAQSKCSLSAALKQVRLDTVKPEITPEHHAAANYFGVVTPWHPTLY